MAGVIEDITYDRHGAVMATVTIAEGSDEWLRRQPRPRVLSQIAFWNLLSLDEKTAVLALRATSPLMAVWWEDYKAATEFERDHPLTREGVDVLVYEEVITPERAAAIIAGWPTV